MKKLQKITPIDIENKSATHLELFSYLSSRHNDLVEAVQELQTIVEGYELVARPVYGSSMPSASTDASKNELETYTYSMVQEIKERALKTFASDLKDQFLPSSDPEVNDFHKYATAQINIVLRKHLEDKENQ